MLYWLLNSLPLVVQYLSIKDDNHGWDMSFVELGNISNSYLSRIFQSEA